jgi:hypothetical protein
MNRDWMRAGFMSVRLVAVLGCRWAAVGVAIGGWIGLGGFGVAGGGIEPNVSESDPAKVYRDFIAQPPWIKKVVFERTPNPVRIEDKPYTGPMPPFDRYEGALQPQGYYVKYLDGVAYWRLKRGPDGLVLQPSKPEPGEEGVRGASDRHYWCLGPGHMTAEIAPRRPEEGAYPYHGEELAARLWMGLLDRVRRLGLERLTNAAIRWEDSDRFAGSTQDGQPVSGSITRYTNGLPAQVEYCVGDTNWFVVQYAYLPGRPFPPYEVVWWAVGGGGEPRKTTNRIEVLEVGLDPAASNGYLLTQFRTKTNLLTSLLYCSNGVRYEIDRAGQWHKVDERVPDWSELTGGISRAAGLTVLVLAVAGLSTGLYLARWAQSRRSQTQTQQQDEHQEHEP